MTAPRLEVDLDKIRRNTDTLVKRLKARGISVTGVAKAVLGAPQIADVFIHATALERAGIHSLSEGQTVSFDTEVDARSGKTAVANVQVA